ncbi:MAG: hypothetical protein HYU42_02615 [Candidatus Rokubacteria bacterium]|nr:hypothetical protein [Candidatus Rokubacteria bacterium]
MARRIDTKPVAKGKLTRGSLGVSIQPLTPELATSFGLREAERVLISDVVHDSPAEKAGIAAGNINTDFGDPRAAGRGSSRCASTTASTMPTSSSARFIAS